MSGGRPTFQLQIVRLTFQLQDQPLTFPVPAANMIRGAFGLALSHVDPVAYEQIFRPTNRDGQPSGFFNLPRVFAIRARPLDGCTINPGGSFSFTLHLFTPDTEVTDFVLQAVRVMAETGMGASRCKGFLLAYSIEPVTLLLEPEDQVTEHIRVLFRSPTELKEGDVLVDVPEFHVLFRRIRDRIGRLLVTYGTGPLKMDFRAVDARAHSVQMTAHDLQLVSHSRRSSRTGQRHSLGGFAGQVDYQGSLTEFMPYLRAAAWTGVGRQTTWGKGELEISPIPAEPR